jgi:hypothetical protein
VSLNPLKAKNWRFCRTEQLISNFSLVYWQWKRKVLLSSGFILVFLLLF